MDCYGLKIFNHLVAYFKQNCIHTIGFTNVDGVIYFVIRLQLFRAVKLAIR